MNLEQNLQRTGSSRFESNVIDHFLCVSHGLISECGHSRIQTLLLSIYALTETIKGSAIYVLKMYKKSSRGLVCKVQWNVLKYIPTNATD